MGCSKTTFFLAALLAVLLPAAARAAEAELYEDEVPIELARYLVAGATLLDAPTADFPALPLPAGLRVLGAALSGSEQTVVVEVTGDVLAVAAELRGNLLQSGWRPRELRLGLPELFRSSTRPTRGIGLAPALCLDGEGQLEIRPQGGMLVLRLQRLPPGTACASQPPPGWGQPDPVLDRAQPGLDIETAEFLQRLGGRNGEQRWEEVVLRGPDMSLSLLSQDFAAQLRAQGWQEEGAWLGERSAGSRWRWINAEGEEGEAVWGQLELILHDAESCRLRFTLARETFRPR